MLIQATPKHHRPPVVVVNQEQAPISEGLSARPGAQRWHARRNLWCTFQNPMSCTGSTTGWMPLHSLKMKSPWAGGSTRWNPPALKCASTVQALPSLCFCNTLIRYGASVKTSQGKARQTLSLTDLAGVAASASKFLCPWSIVYSWEGGKQEAKDNTKPVLAEKTPRDQFQISESFGDDVMLASLNMPFVEMPTLFNDRVKHLMMQEQKIQEKFSQGASAVAADRSSDMPFIILRGKNFLVTYGWAPNGLSPKLRDEFLNLRVESQAVGESLADVALDELFARAFEISVAQLEAVVDSSTAESDACDADRSPPHHLVFYHTQAVLM